MRRIQKCNTTGAKIHTKTICWIFLIITVNSALSKYVDDIVFPDGLNKNNLPEKDKKNVTTEKELHIVSRSEWLAERQTDPLDPLKLPVPYIIIHHTATESCSNSIRCAQIVRHIQNLHVKVRGWWDIGYNFLIGGDGLVYEGRGWTSQGAHLYGYNAKSIGIAFIGNLLNKMPSEDQIEAAKKLIEIGVEKEFVDKNYKVFAAKQLANTLSPGEPLSNNIKTWRHWAEKP